MSEYKCIDAYKDVPENDEWLECPNCGLKPRVWEFDNGRSTACGCGENRYDHFTIHSESIMSVYKRTGSSQEYNIDDLKLNWNQWCSTGKITFEHAGKRTDGRW